ncbi:hypothetical protein F5Y16DRAFT_364635 [Xylariaceae sp. FL0255]|nr:hypothetical protein F5Y16DRAFT_364635 [Xylariaceae sp. FL0255]
MKSLKMSKVLNSITRKNTSGPDISDDGNDNPESIAKRSVKAFCESGNPQAGGGDEVIYLPLITEAAESSPAAAAECAYLLRKYLKKDYWTRPDYQYNALMLVRILAENPSQTFTRNLDAKFTDTARELLKLGRDGRVRQMLMETLTSFEQKQAQAHFEGSAPDDGLASLVEMWKKEKDKAQKATQGRMPTQSSQPPSHQIQQFAAAPPVMMGATYADPHSQNIHARGHDRGSSRHRGRKLPDAVELAARLGEARESANLLQDVVTNTAPGEVLGNDLIKELSDRCSKAQRSIQGYINADDPSPDNETMGTLLDVNEHLQSALGLHQRAMLNARKHVASLTGDEDRPISLGDSNGGTGLGISRESSPLGAGLGLSEPSGSGSRSAPRSNGKGKEREYDPSYAGPSAGPSRSRTPLTEEDPFRDPDEPAGGSGSGAAPAAGGSSSRYTDNEASMLPPRLDIEPFHPGFGTTPSYVGRQDSAIGKEAMHGAVGNSSSGSGRAPPAAVEVSEDDYSDDGYHPPPGPPPKSGKDIVYRY